MNILWAVDACEAVESDSSVGGLLCTRSPAVNSIAMARFTRQKQNSKDFLAVLRQKQHRRGVLLTAACFFPNYLSKWCWWTRSECELSSSENRKRGKAIKTNLIETYYWLMLLSRTAKRGREREREENVGRARRVSDSHTTSQQHILEFVLLLFFILFLRHSLIRSPAVSLCEKITKIMAREFIKPPQ